jgi:hypothetical protein
MMEDKVWIFWVAVLIFIFTLPKCFSTFPFSNEITVFPVSYEKGQSTTAKARIVFTVFPERQEVIATTLYEDKEMNKLQKCTVRDKQNWVCSNPYIEHKMVDGTYTETSAYSTKYTSGWYWWYVHFCNWADERARR